ncbi:MAG TPA: 30S ribosomal protein S17 [Candidatus Korarchaeota archaeon]|nr:30S ribosomal protein S17 [Candidatus Korarchaeota archaeon]
MSRRRTLPDYMISDVIPPQKECDDDKCPWHGTISVRGKTLVGEVVSTRMQRTVTVLIRYLHYVPKFKRYERRRSKIHAHLPPCIEVKEGDIVKIAETRRLAKTVSHVVLGVVKGKQPQA